MSTANRISLEVGKSYLFRYKRFPERKNAKTYEDKAQILGVTEVFDRTLITTNHRPWGEGGTGTFWLDQIESATEIPRGSMGR